jgi:hypothetical protein
MHQHSWFETLSVERSGEAVLDALFAPQFIIVAATRAHQRQKIDRFHIKRNDGRVVYRVDYKVDEKAACFGNLALEHVSVRRNGRIVDRGWVHTTIADLLVSYVPAWDIAFVLEIRELRQRWGEIQEAAAIHPPTGRKLRQTGTPGSHITEFYAVPVKWLREQGFLKKELRAVNLQLRLKLRAGK